MITYGLMQKILYGGHLGYSWDANISSWCSKKATFTIVCFCNMTKSNSFCKNKRVGIKGTKNLIFFLLNAKCFLWHFCLLITWLNFPGMWDLYSMPHASWNQSDYAHGPWSCPFSEVWPTVRCANQEIVICERRGMRVSGTYLRPSFGWKMLWEREFCWETSDLKPFKGINIKTKTKNS